MNFNTSTSEDCIFTPSPVFKNAIMRTNSAPVMFSGFQRKEFALSFEPAMTLTKSQSEPQPTQTTTTFPLFDGDTSSAFGMISIDKPIVLLKKLRQILASVPDVDDFPAPQGEVHCFHGRYFGKISNAEFEMRVFALQTTEFEGSYVNFRRWFGDSWEFSNFVTKILSEFPEESAAVARAVSGLPALDFEECATSAEDLMDLLEDVEENFQDTAEYAAARLAAETQNEDAKRICDEIEGFCPRVLQIIGESSNCAIVRSLLITLTNLMTVDGLTRRIVGQHVAALRGVSDKWCHAQSILDGLFEIAPSRQVQSQVSSLLMAV